MCAPQFARVREEFERNFAERGEVGASVCVTIDGERVVDLWGGIADQDSGRAWERDTISVVFSSSKGATALCLHILAARRQVDLDAPVTTYWPEFGQQDVTVGMVLAHRSGITTISEPLPDGAFFDWPLMTNVLARQPPEWKPGSRHGYQALTFGWLAGEIVRRVSGRPLGAFLRTEVAEPLGLDLWFGLPESEEPRVAPMIFPAGDAPDQARFMILIGTEPESVPARIFLNSGGYMLPGPLGFDSRAAHAAAIGAAGLITNARGLAGMYAPLACGGELNGVRLVGERELVRMGTTVSAGPDATLLHDTRFSYGFMRSTDNRRRPPQFRDSMILSSDAFGHPGFGGGIGFASPAHRMSFAYTMNNMGPGTLLNPRGQRLVDAVYRSLGHTDDSAEIWR